MANMIRPWLQSTVLLLLSKPCWNNPYSKVPAPFIRSRLLSPGREGFRGTTFDVLGGGDANDANADDPGVTGDVTLEAASSRNISLDQPLDGGAGPKQVYSESDVVQLTISFAKPKSAIVVTQRDLESWICYLSGFVAEKLISTASRDHVVVLVVHNNSFDSASNSLTLEAVSSSAPDQLLTDLKKTIDATALNAWLQTDLPNTNPLYNATVVESTAILATAGDPAASFNTADCGVAHVIMTFGFESDLTWDTNNTEATNKIQQDVYNMMCSSSDYFTLVYGTPEAGSGVTITLDRVAWELDPTAANSMTVSFDLLAAEPETKRRIPPAALLEWMAKSDMAYYIDQAVWTALPYETNIFYDTNGVFFDGQIRSPKADTPAQTMSTLDCVDGIYPPKSTTDEEAVVAVDPSIMELTTWTLHFGFEPGFNLTEPTSEDVEGLFCQTFFYYKDMFRPKQRTAYQPIAYTNMTMEVSEYTYTPGDEMPFRLYLDAQAYLTQGGARVDPQVLRGKMEYAFHIETYIMDYVWQAEPLNKNIMLHTSTVEVEPGVRKRHASLRFDLNSSACFRETEAPSESPTDGPSATPSMAPTVLSTDSEEPTAVAGVEGLIGGVGAGIGDGSAGAISSGSGISIGGGVGGEGTANANGGANSGSQGFGSGASQFADLGSGALGNQPVEENIDDGSIGAIGSGSGISVGAGIGGDGIGSANGGVSNGAQGLGSGASEFAELGSGSLGNQTGEGTGDGSTGAISSGSGISIGGIGEIGGESIPSNSHTVTVETSLVLLHFPTVPVSDGSDHLSDALASMLQEMIASKPRPGAGPPQRRGSEKEMTDEELAELLGDMIAAKPRPGAAPPPEKLETELDLDSIQLGNVKDADCRHYYDIDSYSDDMDCSEVAVRYDVTVTGAASEEKLAEVAADFKLMTDTGIKEGLFQESLNEVAPDSGFLVVDDREEEQPNDSSTGSPVGEQQVTMTREPEQGERSDAPSANNTFAPKAKEGGMGRKNLPLWAILVCISILLVVGVLAGMNLCRFWRKREQNLMDTDERLLT